MRCRLRANGAALLVVVLVLTSGLLGVSAVAVADQDDLGHPQPRFTVNRFPREDHMGDGALGHMVWGEDWSPGAEVSVTVNGIERQIQPDPAIVSAHDFGWGYRGAVVIDTIVEGVAPGDTVVLSDEVSTASHVVTALTVTQANPAGAAVEPNVVRGTTNSRQGMVEVRLWTDAGGHGRRHAEIQSDGSWMADFSVRVEDLEGFIDYGKVYDLPPGSMIRAREHDDESNATFAYREVSDAVTFTGFYAPLNGTDTITARAGQGVPMKGNTYVQGVPVENAAAEHEVISRSVPCEPSGTGTEDDPLVADDAGHSSLRWDSAAGQYVFVWRTHRNWANSCREFTVTYQDTPLTVQVRFIS
jgi:hypothetical protein